MHKGHPIQAYARISRAIFTAGSIRVAGLESCNFFLRGLGHTTLPLSPSLSLSPMSALAGKKRVRRPGAGSFFYEELDEAGEKE